MPHTPFDTDGAATLHGACTLPHWGVIEATGEDAARFLHGQLTQDVLLLPIGQARLAAFCSAKGRVQASFIVIKTAPDTVLLITPADVLPNVLRRLSLFVLRAKAKLQDASAQWVLHGAWGDHVRALTQPMPQAQPWQACTLSGGAWAVALHPAITAAGAIVPRALQIAPVAAQAAPTPIDAAALATWHWAEVMSGVAPVGQSLADLFVPQMLNYESIGGVNFKKGCYPGQEVVARSQFRGTLKRRTARVYSPVPMHPGQEVFTPSEPDQACATVLLCAPQPHGDGFAALVSGTLDSMAHGWHAGSAQGPALVLLPLPYALLDDI